MGNLIVLIVQLFKSFYDDIFIIENHRKFSYSEIYYDILKLRHYFNTSFINKSETSIILCADNSKDWIICFFAILLSKHKLIIVSTKMTDADLIAIAVNHNTCLVICNEKRRSISKYPMIRYKNVETLDNLSFEEIPYELRMKDELENETSVKFNKSLLIISKKDGWLDLEETIIPFREITDKISSLSKSEIFKHGDNYIAEVSFANNYLLGLLLPFMSGTTIIIPYKKKDIHGLYNSLQSYQPEVVILTGKKFKELYREYIDSPFSFTNELLKKRYLWWIRKYILKKKFKTTFGKLRVLILVNSRIDNYIDSTIKRLKIPFTNISGNVENCGIESYISPEMYRESNELAPLLLNNPMLAINREIEKSFSCLPLILDCMTLEEDDKKIILLARIDLIYCDNAGYTQEEICLVLERKRREYNRMFSGSLYQVSTIIPYFVDFVRDDYDNPIEELYKKELHGK